MPAMDVPLLLASRSPRRRRLIAWLGAPFAVTEADTPEDLDSPLASVPPVLARSIAADKARAARAGSAGSAAIVACDTIVLHERRILGKPRDMDEALAMLNTLSSRTHEVITGVAILLPEWEEPRTFAVTTRVAMSELTEEAVLSWAEKGELMGCAGAYNIESHLATVEPDQCYQNVAGLPLCHLYCELERWGVPGLTSPVDECERARRTCCLLGPRVVRQARSPV
jgi:septum formation protein